MTEVPIEAIRRDLRGARPVAPEALRARIEAVASREPPRRPRSMFTFLGRRAAVVIVPAALAAALAAAAVYGVATSRSPDQPEFKSAPVPGQGLEMQRRGSALSGEPSAGGAFDAHDQGGERRALALPQPSGTRLQNYAVTMRLRLPEVDGLSRATQRALQTTRSLGGYVVRVEYNTPSRKRGDAYLELRVPVGRIQTAVVRLSSLGTILSQRVSIEDVQGRADLLTRQIRRQREALARVLTTLRNPNLSDAERARLERRAGSIRRALLELSERRRLAVRRAQFATVSLALTTGQAAAKQEAPGRLERTVRNAGDFLVRELAFLLYALIVLSPLIVLAALALFGARVVRRRSEERLLAHS